MYNQDSGGFTLLEVLVALVILMLAAGSLTRTLVTGMTLSSRAVRQTAALEVARNALAVAEGSGARPASLTTSLENGFERTVTVRARPDLVVPVAGYPTPYEIDVVVGWDEGGTPRSLALSTLRFDARP